MAERSTAIIRLHYTNDQPERVEHLEKHPEPAARLLIHLLANTDPVAPLRQTLEGDALNEMIPKLPGLISPEPARLLREQAVRLDMDI